MLQRFDLQTLLLSLIPVTYGATLQEISNQKKTHAHLLNVSLKTISSLKYTRCFVCCNCSYHINFNYECQLKLKVEIEIETETFRAQIV